MKALTILLAGAALLASPGAFAQERTVKITGFGAKSGVVRVFGINSEAAMKAAAEEINKAGGVTLGDGSKAKFAIEFLDDRCNAEEGISVRAPHRLERRFRRGRADLLQRRRVAVRHPAEEGGRRLRHRPAIPDHRRRRRQGRACQDLRMGVPQRAERIRDVQVAVRLAQDAASRPQDHLSAASRRTSRIRMPPMA